MSFGGCPKHSPSMYVKAERQPWLESIPRDMRRIQKMDWYESLFRLLGRLFQRGIEAEKAHGL